MSISSRYFLAHAEARAAEEQHIEQSKERLNHVYYNRQLINEQWALAAQDQEREAAYQAHIDNSKGEVPYDLS